MPKITVFTPVYNRPDTMQELFESLCAQTWRDFEWLIVDDGSTPPLSANYKADFPIRCLRAPHGGKHRAINLGVSHAQGEFFFIVDSDARLPPDALQWVAATAAEVASDPAYAGIAGIRISPQGTKIGGGPDFGTINASALDIRYLHRIKGDLAEIYKTDILRQYPFPEFAGELFCPEALVWNRIARRHILRYCHQPIYICQYRPDGLSARITRLRHQSPRASRLCYSELFHATVPLRIKLRAALNYLRFLLRAVL